MKLWSLLVLYHPSIGHYDRVREKAPIHLAEGVSGGGSYKYTFLRETSIWTGIPFYIYQYCKGDGAGPFVGIVVHNHRPAVILEAEAHYRPDMQVVALEFQYPMTRNYAGAKFFFTYDP